MHNSNIFLYTSIYLSINDLISFFLDMANNNLRINALLKHFLEVVENEIVSNNQSCEVLISL